MPRWAQWTSFALSALAFIVAVLPRTYQEALTAGASFRLFPFPKLLRFPFFWLGLIYFAVIAIQMLNPAWTYVTNGRSWWVQSLDHIAWLPHGVANMPFRPMNAWRTLLIHGSVWLLVCALWIGLTRRRSARLLLYTIALNGVALAVVAILQRLTGARELLWFWSPGTNYFVASFIYKNHAGAFLLLIVALLLGFAWWHTDRAAARMRRSHPGMVFLFLSLLALGALLFSYALATTALGVALCIILGLIYLVRSAFRAQGGPPRIVSLLTGLLCAGFLALCAYSLNIERVWRTFERLSKEDYNVSVVHRQLAAHATFDMGRDSLWFGHGLGGFRYVFPWYQQHYPEIYRDHRKRRLYWEHTHNDYAEFFAEAGAVGLTLLGAGMIVLIVGTRRSGLFATAAYPVMLGGPLVVAVYAAVDFPTHNPAVLGTGAAILVLVFRWSVLERQSRLRVKT
jgi:Lipid A core - O-antigen ligase and related enzymes